MKNDPVTLQCLNDLCREPNCQTDKFCQRCGTPLIKQYLWAVAGGIETYRFGDLVGNHYLLLGDLIGERYLLKSNRVFLDTKPGLSPEPLVEVPDTIKPYLRLVAYRLHVPQVYSLVTLGKRRTTEILLLQAPIYTDTTLLEGQLMPELFSAWKDATSMRQLNWLWQIATLWQPLSTEGVASSLLEPQLLRVEGSSVRLLQLRPDHTCTPTLPQLGQMWSQLLCGAQRVIEDFLKQICQHLVQGEIHSSQQLVAILDRGLAEVGQKQTRTLKISTYTDTGPSRESNEDTCYPPNGNNITKSPEQKALVIVCDGIGGHEGGSIASNLAIETIQQQVQQIPLDHADLDSTILSNNLEDSVCIANDKISEHNDDENRQGRQRMGTTLVMALSRTHEIYITHIGDSRAYWIRRTSCHQVTLDDDVAAREVRLGYALYSDALQHAFSGSLVQALGMSSSASLHPTVQRFVLDEDCVFLLCSDGLSDYNRVEQYWETEILPILDGKIDVANAAQRLVEIANTQNGHDNVTVGLLHYQVNFFEPELKLLASHATPATVSSISAPTTAFKDANILPEDAATLNPQLLPSQRAPRRSLMPVLLGFILLLSLCGGGVLVYLSKQGTRLSNTSSSTAVSSPSAVPALKEGMLIIIRSDITFNLTALQQDKMIPAQTLSLALQPQQGNLPAGSVLQVQGKQLTSQQDYWLNFKVCSTPGNLEPDNSKIEPSSPVSNSHVVQPGDEGQIQASTIEFFILSIPSIDLKADYCPAASQTEVREDAPTNHRLNK